MVCEIKRVMPQNTDTGTKCDTIRYLNCYHVRDKALMIIFLMTLNEILYLKPRAMIAFMCDAAHYSVMFQLGVKRGELGEKEREVSQAHTMLLDQSDHVQALQEQQMQVKVRFPAALYKHLT